MGTLDQARAQETKLPGITVEGGGNGSKKKAQSAPAPKQAATPAPAPAPATPTVATTPSEAAYQTPAAVSSVGQGEIETFGQAGLDNVLRSMPGTFTRESPNNAGVAVNIRGFEGSGRVNMMIDGVRQNFRFTGHEAQGFTYVDPLLLAGIDVQRGAVSTAGGGALEGSANFRTLGVDDILKAGQKQGVLAIGSWGSNGLGWSGMTAGAVTNGYVGVAGAISKHDEDNYKNGDGIIVPFTYQEPTSGLIKADFRLTNEQTLKFGGVFYDNDFLANSYFQHLKSNTYTAKYAYDPVDNALVSFRLNGYRNEVKMHYGTDFDPNSAPPGSPPGTPLAGSAAGRFIDDEGWGFDTSNTSRFHLGQVRVESIYGYEYFADDVFVINSATTPNRGVNPNGNSSIGAFFSQTTFSYLMFDLIAGLRYDRYTLDGSGSVTAANPLFPLLPAGPYTIDRDDERFDPKITLAAHATSWLQPYVTYAEAMRAPTVSETLTGGEHPATGGPTQMFFPNPFLDPEIQEGWEYGANIRVDGLFERKDRFRFKGDYFRQNVENYITACFTAMGGNYFCNAPGISNVWGVELQGMYDAGYLFTGLGYTHTHTDLPSQIGGFGASQYLPEDTLTLTGGLRFLDEKLTIGARGYFVSKAYNGADQVQKLLGPGVPASFNPNGDPNNPFYDGYELLDLFSNYKFDNGVEAALTVTNVFDLAYTPALSTPTTNFVGDTGRGRTFLLTTRAQF